MDKLPALKTFVEGSKGYNTAGQGAATAMGIKIPPIKPSAGLWGATKGFAGGAVKRLSPLGYAIDVAQTGNEIYQGRGDQYAEDTAKGMTDSLTGQDGWYGASVPVKALGTVFSPVQNANLIAHGASEIGSGQFEVGRQEAQASQTSYDLEQQRIKSYTKLMQPIIAKHQAWEQAGSPAVAPEYSPAERAEYEKWKFTTVMAPHAEDAEMFRRKYKRTIYDPPLPEEVTATNRKLREAREALQARRLSENHTPAEIAEIQFRQASRNREPQFAP